MERVISKERTIETLWEEYLEYKEEDVRNSLVIHYAYIVKCIALKTVGAYQHFTYMDDLVNEGLIALLDAVEKFDPEKRVKFETYASIKVRGAMIDYIRKQDCFPRRLKRIAKNISDAENTLSYELGRYPLEQEMAEYLSVSVEEFQKMQAETCALSMLSFEEMIYEKGVEDIRFSGSADTIQGPEQVVAEKELQVVLADYIEKLNEKEKMVISLYYKEQMKIKEISAVMGISDSRVSQIHSNGLKKLKRFLTEYNS
ncbi:MAG: FliA/WhiG family RNA polymerase sigma factor [Clostridium sp.]|uniref:sigma-70 family RNA polymerase sigma factor n=1 Tax=Clostridium sp. TaxID=1506 RepID=UPI00291518AC|nr:FliA/WhiG family RNA polymerase sigma factor [Clostridium sp.]MDU7337007.1 FliA/WhiG family RNA polymerase sigma factor [Clostridium sp.]